MIFALLIFEILSVTCLHGGVHEDDGSRFGFLLAGRQSAGVRVQAHLVLHADTHHVLQVLLLLQNNKEYGMNSSKVQLYYSDERREQCIWKRDVPTR